jgi:hypothetical protein
MEIGDTSSLVPLLVDSTGQLLANLVAANHDRASRRDFQAPRRPATEKTGHALLAVDMPQETGHRAVLRKVLGSSGTVL